MGKFDQRGGGRERGGFGGGRDRGRGGFGGGRDRDARPEMFRATCAECGSSCEVPFKPSGDRPVLCSACFSASKGERPRERSFDNKFSKGGFNDKPSFSAAKPSADISKLEGQIKSINEKLDKILQKLSAEAYPIKDMMEEVEETLAPRIESAKKAISKLAIKTKKVVKPIAKKIVKKVDVKNAKKPAILKKKK